MCHAAWIKEFPRQQQFESKYGVNLSEWWLVRADSLLSHYHHHHHHTECRRFYAAFYTDCPPEVTITPSGGRMAIGDVLTCTSSSTLSTYTFTDSDGTVTDGNTVTLSEEGSFSFTCTATVAMDTPCSATASVSGTAVGKKHNRICAIYVIWRYLHIKL